ncbi:hypothetical protein [Natronogracilivirga saccharolytica]|uniref:Processed acidic surface protein n=1 Tax=Natronogracilivirga saccharolytica TaxID=2812953 RepID=A0A8J7RPU4_9BACT|nr:hypothetical protein [Natronogracilivirga saccharolytica]MBP3193714.1 hypothetical protein [Natronogracilivirga saccharolytica]
MEKLNIKTVLAALLVLAVGFTSQVQAQFQSDFRIKQNFDQDHAEVMDALKTIETEEEAQSVNEKLDEMEDRYRDHVDLLDRVLYPETLEARMTNLRELTEVTEARIKRIGEKGDTVVVLEERIEELTGDAERYQQRADSLNEELGAMRRSRDANAAQARRLRQELDKRDEFIIKMVDSTFVAYENVDLESLSPDERRDLALEIDAQNVFGHIESVVDNNIDFLNTHTELSTQDFLKLYGVQVEFERMWENMGRDLADIYVSETNRQERLDDIVGKMDEWEMLIDDAAWTTLADAFEQNNIQLSPFSNSLEFYTSLNTYLDEAIERAEDSGGEEEVERYERFANFWFNDVKPRWQEYMISANVLTYDNFNTIDEKLTEWKLHAQPTSYTTLIFLGLAIIIILVLIGLYIKEKGKK